MEEFLPWLEDHSLQSILLEQEAIVMRSVHPPHHMAQTTNPRELTTPDTIICNQESEWLSLDLNRASNHSSSPLLIERNPVRGDIRGNDKMNSPSLDRMVSDAVPRDLLTSS